MAFCIQGTLLLKEGTLAWRPFCGRSPDGRTHRPQNCPSDSARTLIEPPGSSRVDGAERKAGTFTSPPIAGHLRTAHEAARQRVASGGLDYRSWSGEGAGARFRKKDALVITRDAQGGPRDAGEVPPYSEHAPPGEPRDAPRDGPGWPWDATGALGA